MITISRVDVRGVDLGFLDIFWQVADTAEDISEYLFRVLRSESPEGPFEYISTPLREVFSFRDDKVDLYSQWRIFYYRIEVRHEPSNDVGESEVAYLGYRPDLEALEMMRLQQVALQVQIGVPAIILPRRTSGPACPFCFDPLRKRSTDSDCMVCLGTAQYRGGFLDPIGTYIHTSPSQKTIRNANLQETEPSQRVFDMTGYPLMQHGNLIVLQDLSRYWVTNVKNNSHRNFVYRQILQVAEIPRSDAVYRLVIDPSKFPDPMQEGALWPKPAEFGPLRPKARKVPSDPFFS